MIPPRYTDAQRSERLRKLLALEISRIVEDLAVRRDFLMDVWSLHRKREPFLDTVHSRWGTLGFPMLAELTTEEVAVVDTFYRELDEFRLYISFTQDMPTTLGERYDWICERIRAYGELAIDALGGEPDRPLVDFEDDAEEEAAHLLEFPQERARPQHEEPAEGAEGPEGAEEGQADGASAEVASEGDAPAPVEDAAVDEPPESAASGAEPEPAEVEEPR